VGLLFAAKTGTPWDHSLVWKRKFHPLLKKLGIPQCGFHAFRHGNATLLDQIDAPMAVRLNRLGHAEAQTTMGYTHAVTADERRIADQIGKILHATARNEQEEGPASVALTQMIQFGWLRGLATIRAYPQFPSLLGSSQITSDSERYAECVDKAGLA
jgi:hypothetical protein